MRVFVYACEEMYHGLHGIEDMRVVEVESVEEADEYGREMSADIIESFDTIGDFDEYEDEEAYEEAFLDAREWYVYPIDEEKAKGLSIEELDRLASTEGRDYFVEEYCGEMFE